MTIPKRSPLSADWIFLFTERLYSTNAFLFFIPVSSSSLARRSADWRFFFCSSFSRISSSIFSMQKRTCFLSSHIISRWRTYTIFPSRIILQTKEQKPFEARFSRIVVLSWNLSTFSRSSGCTYLCALSRDCAKKSSPSAGMWISVSICVGTTTVYRPVSIST